MSISYDDFKKLDLRVAKILKIEKIPGKTKIVKGEIDLGDETRNVIIGGAEFYEPDDCTGSRAAYEYDVHQNQCDGN